MRQTTHHFHQAYLIDLRTVLVKYNWKDDPLLNSTEQEKQYTPVEVDQKHESSKVKKKYVSAFKLR